MTIDAIERRRISAWLLPALSIAFLFIGFIKGLFASPVDLTLLLAALTFAAAAIQVTSVPSLITPVTIALGLLCAWLAIRAAPDPNPWAIRKLGEILVLGGPAYLAGQMIAASEDAKRATLKILAVSGAPVSILVVLQAAAGNPYSFSSFGSGGYQLTGLFLAFAFVSAAILRWPVLFAISALGCAVSGNIAGAAFGAIVVIGIWFVRRSPMDAIKASGGTFALFALYTALVAPPLIFMRLLWKTGGAVLYYLGQPVTPEESAQIMEQSMIGSKLNFMLRIMPQESQKYLVDYTSNDRTDLFAEGWRAFMESPIFGSGYGAIDYLGNSYPHNVILEIAAETGLVGVALLAILFAVAIRGAVRSRDPMIIGFLTIVLLTAMFSGHFGQRLFLFCLGMAGASYVRSR